MGMDTKMDKVKNDTNWIGDKYDQGCFGIYKRITISNGSVK